MDKDVIRIMAYPLWIIFFLLVAIFWFNPAFLGVVTVLCVMVFDFALVWYLKLTGKQVTIFGKKLKYGK